MVLEKELGEVIPEFDFISASCVGDAGMWWRERNACKRFARNERLKDLQATTCLPKIVILTRTGAQVLVAL
jgi:hypothetical protein